LGVVEELACTLPQSIGEKYTLLPLQLEVDIIRNYVPPSIGLVFLHFFVISNVEVRIEFWHCAIFFTFVEILASRNIGSFSYTLLFSRRQNFLALASLADRPLIDKSY
jgi:hypothetical protein